MKFLYNIKQKFYEILTPLAITASGLVACEPVDQNQFVTNQEHHVYVTLDLDKLYINTYDNLSAAFLELENDIDRTLQEHDVSRVVIKVANKDIAKHLTADDWKFRVREPLLRLETKYDTLSDPVHIYGNDTLPILLRAKNLKKHEVGITDEDARALHRVGFVFDEIKQQTTQRSSGNQQTQATR